MISESVDVSLLIVGSSNIHAGAYMVTKEKLFDWGLAQDNICTNCHEDIDSLPHILVECEV